MKIVIAANGKKSIVTSKRELDSILKSRKWKVAFAPTSTPGAPNVPDAKNPQKDEIMKKLKRLIDIFSLFSKFATEMAGSRVTKAVGYIDQQEIVMKIPEIVSKLRMSENELKVVKQASLKLLALNDECMKLSEDVTNADFVSNEDGSEVHECFLTISSAEEEDANPLVPREDGEPENPEAEFRAKYDPYDLAIVIQVGLEKDNIDQKLAFLKSLYQKSQSL